MCEILALCNAVVLIWRELFTEERPFGPPPDRAYSGRVIALAQMRDWSLYSHRSRLKICSLYIQLSRYMHASEVLVFSHTIFWYFYKFSAKLLYSLVVHILCIIRDCSDGLPKMHISDGQPQGGVWVVSIAFSSPLPWQDARNSSRSLLTPGIDELLYSQKHCSILLMFEWHYECIPWKMHQWSNLRKVLLRSTTLSIRHQKRPHHGKSLPDEGIDQSFCDYDRFGNFTY